MASPHLPAAEFVPLDAETVGNATKKRHRKNLKDAPMLEQSKKKKKQNVVYIGRIPHGFYEEQMKSYFSQFGNIKRLRISRNKKTGKSKHYGFIEFESPEVAEIVAESMHNYLLLEHMLQVRLVPSEKIHPRMWIGSNHTFKPPNQQQLERMRNNREREPEEQQKLLNALLKRDKKRRKKLEATGIEYDFPDLRLLLPAVSKKIKFSESEDEDDSSL